MRRPVARLTASSRPARIWKARTPRPGPEPDITQDYPGIPELRYPAPPPIRGREHELKRGEAGLSETHGAVHGDALRRGVQVDHPRLRLVAEPLQQGIQARPSVAAPAVGRESTHVEHVAAHAGEVPRAGSVEVADPRRAGNHAVVQVVDDERGELSPAGKTVREPLPGAGPPRIVVTARRAPHVRQHLCPQPHEISRVGRLRPAHFPPLQHVMAHSSDYPTPSPRDAGLRAQCAVLPDLAERAPTSAACGSVHGQISAQLRPCARPVRPQTHT